MPSRGELRDKVQQPGISFLLESLSLNSLLRQLGVGGAWDTGPVEGSAGGGGGGPVLEQKVHVFSHLFRINLHRNTVKILYRSSHNFPSTHQQRVQEASVH